ncbi:lipocalin-like domain-containing protein [Streptomyces sp. NPDC002476]|uniref:lipocalin-like domain-containing protein n=1 Tax=Streptomyces sp. NPDC002476 TaxID=3364648 RepID=UPI0036787975
MDKASMPPADPLLLAGTWQLLSLTGMEKGEITHPLGEDAHGQIMYTMDGCLSAQIGGSGGYVGYAGRYEVHNDVVVHRTIVGSTPQWENTAFSRTVEFRDGRLILRAEAANGLPAVTVVWKRVSH